ncbi:MAG: adenylyltransferase/cytidyltransferase family protein [Deltaproteobacteria bacterium]|nr:adenylyltransferase/cytidyltransferase family protein [Deltaproteobacteria bacterium]
MQSIKLKTVEELSHLLAERKGQGKKIVLCHGVFDLIHPGHIHHFEEAKRQGDILVVSITPDNFVNKGPGRPVFNQRLRADFLTALEMVDYVTINRWPTAVETIRFLRPDIYVKGWEYSDGENDVTQGITKETEAVHKVGGGIFFTRGDVFSSTELLNAYFDVHSPETKEFLRNFRQKYSAENVIGFLDQLRSLKVLVIGETIIDEYLYCHTMNKSAKDNILVSRYLYEEAFAGGILACANHMAGFCGQVDLVSVLGKEDDRQDFIRSRLHSKVRPYFFFGKGKTIVKRRFVDPQFVSKLFEVCYLPDPEPMSSSASRIEDFLATRLPEYDLVLAVDYGHGFFQPGIIGLLSEKSSFLAINTQTNSANLGFNVITKYPKANFISLSEPEIRLATHDRDGSLEESIGVISRQLHCRQVAVTRGKLGSITYREPEGFFSAPVFSNKVVDRIGAGDAYLSITAPCAVKNYPIDLMAFVGNAVGAMAVNVVCNREPVAPVHLYKFITALLK